MSMAGQGALSGAASGAAAGTMIMPGWGTAIGGVIGGAAGLLGGMGGDKAAAAKRAAAKRLQRAQARYGAQTTELNTAAGAEAGQMGQDYHPALQQYVGQHPDAMPRFQQAQQQFTQDQQMAQAPAWANPAQVPGGGTGAEQRYLAALQADRQGRTSAALAPGTMQLARQEVGRQDQLGQQDIQHQQAAMAQAMDRLRGMTGLQQQLNYEPLHKAGGRYAIDRQRAEQAGSRQALASGLLSSAGTMAGAFGVAQASRPGGAAAIAPPVGEYESPFAPNPYFSGPR